MLLNTSLPNYAFTISMKSCDIPFGLRPWTIFNGASVYELKVWMLWNYKSSSNSSNSLHPWKN